MKRKIFLFIILNLILCTISGCTLFKKNGMENINIITTNYALEYAIKNLYGDNSLITSIYPDGVNIDNYTFTDKQIRDYSSKDMFIYMGLTNDATHAVTFLNRNDKIKIIDASFGMQYKNKEDELWINPSNLLMISQNIKNGLSEYITSTYLLKNIDKAYDELKVSLSTLDAEFKTSIENANSKTIFVNNDVLLYLTKYDLNVLSLDKNNLSYDKNFQLFKNYLKQGTVKYLFEYEGTTSNEEIQKYIDENQIETITFRNLKNITDEERKNEKNYLSLMYDNLDNLKKELYKNN